MFEWSIRRSDGEMVTAILDMYTRERIADILGYENPRSAYRLKFERDKDYNWGIVQRGEIFKVLDVYVSRTLDQCVIINNRDKVGEIETLISLIEQVLSRQIEEIIKRRETSWNNFEKRMMAIEGVTIEIGN